MVRAILAGRKTQTRRVIAWPGWVVDTDRAALVLQTHPALASFADGRPMKVFSCPYGGRGDRLWVKETWGYRGSAHHYPGGNKPRPPNEVTIHYRADDTRRNIERPIDAPDPVLGCGQRGPGVTEEEWGRVLNKAWAAWRPSIYMPRWASRITLELTEVRVQRVQEISNEDAVAEGFPQVDGRTWGRLGFSQTWDSLNAKRGYGWDVNAWVWALTFKVAR
jgi:hypothetical protein